MAPALQAEIGTDRDDRKGRPYAVVLWFPP